MFRSSRKDFRFSYYISSLMISYGLLIIYMLLSKLEDVEYDFSDLIVNWWSPNKIVFGILLILFLFSLFSLKKIQTIILDNKNAAHTLGIYKIKVNEKYNQGFRDFIMSVLVPIISSFSITDHAVSTLVILLLVQYVTYKFYVNSSDIFPNVSLAIWGYSIFIGIEQKDEFGRGNYGKTWYVLGKTNEIENIILSDQKMTPFGDPSYINNNIGVILEDTDNEN
ncbi:hypothetical protein MST23_04720 [Pediococcus acidilactici]|uniref:hypothetical protein n=2 Tax=Pediococcus acidilactici TaxID=1254 RepID=UPI0009473E95|nr:hypothetical protein [Pediococcus acidilactici]APR27937.1 hypothetical protein BTW26_02410 [Pediococcus acidilactici]MCJ2192146.1 hypothetical protein [Pediococcus acidilactici]MWB52963.1 hypothetical protein [Pediococcus acidilactici]QAR70681.1 hypothetical protein EQJ92_02390 [Pediococcus acidilactici]QHS02384.1 hypothetical protein GWA24_00935 [Pediococcus acidilactici]